MKARLVEYDDERAVVRLEPGWLARLFGARPSLVELLWTSSGEDRGWVARGSGRWHWDLPHRRAILDALDFLDPEAPPRPRFPEDGGPRGGLIVSHGGATSPEARSADESADEGGES